MSKNASNWYFLVGFFIGLFVMIIVIVIKENGEASEAEAKAAQPIPQQLDNPLKQTIPEKITLECGSKLLSINFNNNSLTILTTPFEKFDKAVSYDFIVDGKKSTILECELSTR
jgi:hypothetical protein